jgi:DNA-binding transcriptional LysR family regulator
VDRFDEYGHFIRVAHAGSFTKAADEVGLTTSALSKHVKALEARLGVRLLNRTTRRVALTESGRAFLERAELIVGEVAEAESALADLDAQPRGVLRVGAPMDFGRLHLSRAIASFMAAQPELRIEIELTDRAVDLLEDGLDVVVRIGALRDSSLVARRLGPCRRVVCASPAYLDAQGRPEQINDLTGYQRIGYAYESERSWTFETSSGPVRINVPIGHKSNNGEVTRALLLEGLGIALLPTFLVAEDLRSGRLESVLAEELESVIPIHALYPHRKHLSAKVRVFVDHLVNHCGPQPYWDEGIDSAAGAERGRKPSLANQPTPISG